MNSARIAFGTGISAASLIVLATLLAASRFPGYSHARQYISELGAHGAPDGALVTYGMFLPAGVLLVVFAWHAARVLPHTLATRIGLVGVACYAAGYLVAVPFRCEPGCRPVEPSVSQLIHNAAGGLSYFLGAAGLVIAGFAARRWPRATHLMWMGIGGGVVSLLAFSGLSHDFDHAGIAQRVIEASMLAWVVAAAFYIRRGPSRGALPKP